MNLRLRTVGTRAEAQGTLALLEQAVHEVSGSFSRRPTGEITRRYLERCLGQRESLLVIAEPREVERPLALAGSAPFEDPLTGDREAMLVLLYVDPSIRQRGVARELVRELRRKLAERGVTNLWPRAAHNDDAVISMGERWGFVRAWELLTSE